MRLSSRSWWLILLCASISGASFGGPTIRVGSEFQLNAYTIDAQKLAAIDIAANGSFVVVWQSNGQDGDILGVFGRRFSSAGSALGGELQISTYTVGFQHTPALAVEADGDFVVVWRGNLGTLNDYGILGRRFSSSGSPQGTELLISGSTGDPSRPSVAVDGDGDFVVVWQGSDSSYSGIFGRRFNSAGVPFAPAFDVNIVTQDNQVGARVGSLDNGDFVVVWSSQGQDGDEFGVFGRRFDSGGALPAAVFQINTTTEFRQYAPDLAVDSDGDFVVTWTAFGEGPDPIPTIGIGIFGRRFSSLGAAVGAEFEVNSSAGMSQNSAAVSANAVGSFVVAWMGYPQGGDGSTEVIARAFDANGVPRDAEFRVNSYITSNQLKPAVAVDANGKFVIAWEDYLDGSYEGVFAQRFATLVNLDIDGNGSTDALTDGVLTLRYHFGFTGATLITGAVGGGCTRCTAPEILAHLQSQD